jgi:hypothetical protein
LKSPSHIHSQTLSQSQCQNPNLNPSHPLSRSPKALKFPLQNGQI